MKRSLLQGTSWHYENVSYKERNHKRYASSRNCYFECNGICNNDKLLQYNKSCIGYAQCPECIDKTTYEFRKCRSRQTLKKAKKKKQKQTKEKVVKWGQLTKEEKKKLFGTEESSIKYCKSAPKTNLEIGVKIKKADPMIVEDKSKKGKEGFCKKCGLKEYRDGYCWECYKEQKTGY